MIGFDPGKICGLVELIDGAIVHAGNYEPEEAMEYILAAKRRGEDLLVLYEDIQYYTGVYVIETLKLIGQFEYRMHQAGIPIHAVLRWEVKKWCYDTYQSVVKGLVEKLILQRHITNEDTGEPVKPTFVYVNDRIVQTVMKIHWDLLSPGRKSRHGLSKHSWQALAVVSYVMDTCAD